MKNIFLFLLLSANIIYGQQYTLALNLEKGNTYFLKINSTNHFTGEMNGQKMAMNSSMTGIMKFKVVNTTQEGYELEASYDTIHLIVKSPMGQMEFSSGGSENPEFGMMNMMAGKHFNITLLKNGAVSKIESPDTSGFAAMMKNNPMMQGIKQMLMMGPMKQSFSKESMKENIEKLTAIFPNKKVSINESWGSVIKPDSNSDHVIKTSYQLVSYESGIATIKGHTESKASSNKKQSQGMMGMGFMMPIMFDMNGESESTIQINTTTGWIKEAVIKNELKGNVQMKNPNKETKADPFQINSDVKLSSY